MNAPDPASPAPTSLGPPLPSRGWAIVWLLTLMAGYVGVYLCRKNLSVAVPLIQEAFGASKQEVGLIASLSTLAYALGKVLLGPVVDRVGGRTGVLVSMGAVAALGALGGLAPGLGLLTLCYSANRLAGSASWGAMVKLVPDWFPRNQVATAMSWLCVSYVVGGVCAALLAGFILRWTGSWRAVMGLPSLVLLGVLIAAAVLLPRRPRAERQVESATVATPFRWADSLRLFRDGQFRIVLALSFTLTLLRETFNFWTVDFLYREGSQATTLHSAAYLSSLFDLFGIAGILLVGRCYDRAVGRQRGWLLCGILAALAALLAVLPALARFGPGAAALAVGGIGFLVYGPYSLLSGVMAVEVEGKGRAATVAGLVDAAGYVAGWLSGQAFGALITWGGYGAGFATLAALMAGSAVLCLGLRPKERTTT